MGKDIEDEGGRGESDTIDAFPLTMLSTSYAANARVELCYMAIYTQTCHVMSCKSLPSQIKAPRPASAPPLQSSQPPCPDL
jgi:hypothetical protein